MQDYQLKIYKWNLGSHQNKVQLPDKHQMKVGDQAACPYPVSLQRGKHLLPQFNLPGNLVDAVAAAQKRLQSLEGRG